MYQVIIKSQAPDGFIATDIFKVIDQHGIRTLLEAYQITGEKILSFKCKYGKL